MAWERIAAPSALVINAITQGGKEVPNLVINDLVDAVKATGTLGVVGVFIPEDPGATDKLAKQGLA